MDAAHLTSEVFASVDQFARDNTIVEDFAIVINIFKKQVQRCDTLRQSIFHRLPLRRRDDTRQQIIRENALCSFIASVDCEGNALMQKREIGGTLATLKFFGRKL